MARITYMRDGPNKPEYSLSPKGNQEIDERRQRLADSQGKRNTRDRLDDRVRREGGDVHWKGQPEDELVLPYSSRDHKILQDYEEKVARHMKRLEELGLDIDYNLTSRYGLDAFITGTAKFKIMYDAKGHVHVEDLKKGEAPQKPYGFTDAISILRNLERYALNVEKSKIAENRMHGKESQLEKIVASVVAVASTIAGLFFMSGNITGYAVAGTQAAEPSFSLVGLAIFVAGCVGAFLFLMRK